MDLSVFLMLWRQDALQTSAEYSANQQTLQEMLFLYLCHDLKSMGLALYAHTRTVTTKNPERDYKTCCKCLRRYKIRLLTPGHGLVALQAG
jgi:hypothetical protein